jgi:hypothetical protein
MGDKYSQLFSVGIKELDNIHSLNLRSNRLKDDDVGI